MQLALIAWPTVALLALIGLIAVADHRTPSRYVLPAVRTVALVTVAAAYVAALWSH
jgi:hypothetical protein